MTKEELQEVIDKTVINIALIEKIENKYGVALDDTVKHIVSYCEDNMFIGDWRVVSVQEIIDSVEEIHVDFAEYSIIPVFDAMDNNYICYDYEKKNWTVFNIIDQVKFASEEEVYNYL